MLDHLWADCSQSISLLLSLRGFNRIWTLLVTVNMEMQIDFKQLQCRRTNFLCFKACSGEIWEHDGSKWSVGQIISQSRRRVICSGESIFINGSSVYPWRINCGQYVILWEVTTDCLPINSAVFSMKTRIRRKVSRSVTNRKGFAGSVLCVNLREWGQTIIYSM